MSTGRIILIICLILVALAVLPYGFHVGHLGLGSGGLLFVVVVVLLVLLCLGRL